MDTIKVKGSGWIEIFDNGKLISKTLFQNLITNVGKAEFAGLVANLGGLTAPAYIALGSSATAPTVTDTTLTAEISTSGLGRAAATVTRVTISVTNDTIQYFKSFTATGTVTINEIGIFDALSVGNMITHALTTSQPVINTNVVNVTYQIQFT